MKMQSITTVPSTVSFEVLLVKMVPHFRYFAKRVLRLRGDNLDDALQELTLLAFEIYSSLARRGKQTFFTPIMKFAIGKYKSGRRFAGYNSVDVLSEGTKVLGRTDVCTGDTLCFLFGRQDVAHSVEFRLDFENWYQQQTQRDKKIIRLLAMGENPSTIAKTVSVSPAAITYSRRRYAKSWDRYIDNDRGGFTGQSA